MNVLSDEDAIRLYPPLADLIKLRDAGWRFLPVANGDGELVEHDGFRAWPDGWTDGIRIWSETNALGIRTAPNDIPTVVWERTGTLTEVVGELLALPAPDDHTAPRLILGSAPQLWTP